MFVANPNKNFSALIPNLNGVPLKYAVAITTADFVIAWLGSDMNHSTKQNKKLEITLLEKSETFQDTFCRTNQSLKISNNKFSIVLSRDYHRTITKTEPECSSMLPPFFFQFTKSTLTHLLLKCKETKRNKCESYII